MDVDPFKTHFQRKQKKRQEFKRVLRELVEGVALLVEGQRCFADEFGLSYGRVFSDDLESFKRQDTCKVISDWIRSGEEGALSLRILFDDLAQHQLALVEAFDRVIRESTDMGKLKRSKRVNPYCKDAKAVTPNAKSRQPHHSMQEHFFLTEFIAGYAKAREQMRVDYDGGIEKTETGKAVFKC